ncbi:uncharacterized protein LOC118201364 [Stegodyphus dumicola]|uniref:uncharacterized protein LOC118201364 n=1 Tax=Stegodyphus dumicola TaxID=202533 RepID=UPI0015AD6BBA|nr:uncharacterized protein LOC118201364 [Stegodyphus dumicola]
MLYESEVKKPLYFIPGYTGFCPELAEQVGRSYGKQTHGIIEKCYAQLGERLSATACKSCPRKDISLHDSNIRRNARLIHHYQKSPYLYNYDVANTVQAAGLPSGMENRHIEKGSGDADRTFSSPESCNCGALNVEQYLQCSCNDNQVNENTSGYCCIEPLSFPPHSKSIKFTEKIYIPPYVQVSDQQKYTKDYCCCHSFPNSAYFNRHEYSNFCPVGSDTKCNNHVHLSSYVPHSSVSKRSFANLNKRHLSKRIKAIPNYTGYITGYQWAVGETFGKAVERLMGKNTKHLRSYLEGH